MKTKHKLATAALTIILAMVSATSTIFAKTTFDDIIFDLQSLNIMTGDENGDLQLDKPVTRAEFASITVRMMSMQQAADSYSQASRFTDVPDSHWAAKSINFLTSLNVISGTSSNTFSPDDNIDVTAAGKILVCALGYDNIAQIKGGYPSGYTAQANELGILDSVDTSVNPVTRREVARMIFNSLDIDIMITSSISNGYPQYEVDKGNTFRNKFKNENNGIVTKLTGIVTATADTYLNDPVSGIDDTMIEINGSIYQISDPSYRAYIGQRVDFFIDGEDSNVIISMQPSGYTNVQTVSADSITSASSSHVKYIEDENNTSKTIKYDKTAYFIFNNRVIYDWDEDTFTNLKNGTVSFIDNNDDKIADVIIAKEYTSFIVSNISIESNTIYLKEDQLICGKKFIKTDPDSDQRIIFSDKNGNNLSVEDIKDDNILSCYISPDEAMIEIIVNDTIISGKIDGIGKDYISVDGEKYYLEDPDKDLDIKTGTEYDIYLNFNNEAAYVKKQSANENYAYISKIYLEDNGNTYVARLILPNTIQEKKEEEKDADGGAAKVVSKLACQNKSIMDIPLASKISINGVSTNAKDASLNLEKQIVTYHTNSKGQISKVTSPIKIGTGRQKYYNSAERTFGKTSGGAFGVDMDTMTICIPKDNPNPSEDDYLTAVEMNNGQLYDVQAYDRSEETHMANLIVVTMTMKGGTTGLINTKSKVGMIQECLYEFDEETDSAFYNIKILTSEGTTASYRITEAAAESEGFTVPTAGDLVAYSLDLEYNMDAVKILASMAGDLPYGKFTDLNSETFCGYISNIEYNEVSEFLNRWVHIITCVAPSGDKYDEADYEILKNSGPPIFIYYCSSKESTFGTIDDIDISSDEIFISSEDKSVRAVVILK